MATNAASGGPKTGGPKKGRPLSPHLQVYKFRMHMFTSIMHRATGMALIFGAIVLAWWLAAIATGADYFNTVSAIAASGLGRFVLFGLTFALMQHLAGGIRYLFTDTGKLLALGANTGSATFTWVFSVVATIIVWVAAYMVMGAL